MHSIIANNLRFLCSDLLLNETSSGFFNHPKLVTRVRVKNYRSKPLLIDIPN